MSGKKNPLLIITIAFILGIIGGFYINVPLFKEIYAVSFIILILSYFVFVNKKICSVLLSVLLVSAFFVLGFIKILLDNDVEDSELIQKISEQNEKIIIAGIVDEKPVLINNRLSFPLKLSKIYLGNNRITVESKVLLKIRIDTFERKIKNFDYGDKIFASGKLLQPRNTRNPGEFNYSKYLQLKDIQAIFVVNDLRSVILHSEGNGDAIQSKIIQPFRDKISGQIDEKMGPVEGAFLKGLLIGDRAGIPDDIKDDFLNAGVIHVLAVSGLNVAFVILIFSAIFSVFFTGKIIKTFLIIVSLLLYMLLTGSSPSIMRATIMGIVFVFGNSMERKTSMLNVLAFSALIILMIDARELFDLGFQLSFLCVFALVYIYPVLSNMWKTKSQLRIIKIFKESLLGSISVLIFLFPVLAMTSGKVSLISIIANLVVVPLSNLSLAIGLLQVLSNDLSMVISGVFTSVNQCVLWFNLSIIKYFGNLDFSLIEVYNLTIIKTLLYYAFFLFLIYSIKTRKRIYAISAVFLFSNTLIWSNLISGQSDKLKIAFIDVGQGDATLLSLPDGKNILIDAGPKNDNFDSGEKIVYPFLKREGIEKIDYCFISHFHDDHFGGLPFLIKKGMIKTIYFGDSSGCGTICKSLDSLSKSNDVVYKKIDFDKLNIDNSQMYILNRNNYKDIARVKDSISGSNLNIHSGKLTKRKNSAPKTSKNTIENNCSSVLKFCYGNISLLFMGDSEKDKENELIKNYGNFLKSDILKVAHHGSKSGTTDGFIEIVKPDISIIFAGQGNKFKFPSKSVVERIKKNGINLLRTDLEGAIILKTDGKNIERIEWN